MKFSDMMGNKDRDTTEVAEPQLPPEARSAPPVPEAPIRFGGNRPDVDDPAAAHGSGSITPEAPPASPLAPPEITGTEAPPPAPPSISDVVAELAPRPAAAATDQQLDASAWLDGINTIDDDLLPR
jgi:hypothetical protein